MSDVRDILREVYAGTFGDLENNSDCLDKATDETLRAALIERIRGLELEWHDRCFASIDKDLSYWQDMDDIWELWYGASLYRVAKGTGGKAGALAD